MMSESLKPVRWVPTSYEELVAVPRDVQHGIGVALMVAQAGDKHPAAKPLKGFRGAGVLEIVENHDGDTYRAVYTVRFSDAIYMLHASAPGRRARLPRTQSEAMTREMKVTPADGNIFETLGFPDAEELKAKADLVIRIIQIIEQRGLKQVEAAEIMGIDQPKVSQLVNGKLDGFSMERLYRFLNAFGMDVEIVVKPKPESREGATLTVTRRAS